VVLVLNSLDENMRIGGVVPMCRRRPTEELDEKVEFVALSGFKKKKQVVPGTKHEPKPTQTGLSYTYITMTEQISRFRSSRVKKRHGETVPYLRGLHGKKGNGAL
jgi:hypothetical protein